MPLRDVIDDDLPIFFRHQDDPEASRMAAFPARARDAFLRHWRDVVLASPDNLAKTIVVDGQVAGNIVSWTHETGSVSRPAPSGRSAQRRLIGYWIGREHWGRGVATAALAELLADHERTRPLYAYVARQNLGSIRVLEKCGFQRIGAILGGEDGVDELLLRLDA